MDRLGPRCTGIGVRWWRLLLRPCRPRSLIHPGSAGRGLVLSLPVAPLQLLASCRHKSLSNPVAEVAGAAPS